MKVKSLFISFSPLWITFAAYYLAISQPLVCITFIPNERMFQFSLAVYTFLLTLLNAKLIKYINDNSASIDITFAEAKSEYITGNEIQCKFAMDTSKIKVRIKMTGKVKRLSKHTLNIVAPVQVHFQNDKKTKKYYELSGSGSIVEIKLDKILNQKKIEVLNEEVEIAFDVLKNQEIVNSYIETQLIGFGRSNIEFTHNKIKLLK